jgi:hypothetical protein
LTVGGFVDGFVFYDGRDGDDVVTIAEGATVEESVVIRLGDGANAVTHEGVIEDDLRVTSKNEEDTVTVADAATVGGETVLTLGEQPNGGSGGPGGGGHGFGRGRGRGPRR